MARAYLLSHGARVGNQPDTFVPAGRSISFYSEFDQNTLRLSGLAALNAGDIKPTQTFYGPCPVSNYYHSRFEDPAIAQHLANESSASGGTSYYVGDQLPDPSWLCTTPSQCRATYPQHGPQCEGVFKKITEEEIYSVACRGVWGQKNAATRELDGSTELLDENTEEARRLLAWKDTDPAAAMAYWQSLTQATRTMIAATGPGVAFRQFAEQYFAGGGASTTEAVLEARRYLDAYGEDTFFDWVWAMDPAGRQRQLILGNQQLGALFERKSRERLGLPGTHQPSDDQFIATAQTVRKQTETLATAIDLLTGSSDDSNAVSEIGQLYTAIMTDVQSLQQLAGQDQERARNAAGADSTGGSLGQAIAIYSENPDEENLATLRSATEAFFAWVAVLA